MSSSRRGPGTRARSQEVPRVDGVQVWQLEYPSAKPMKSGIHDIMAIHVVAAQVHVGLVAGTGYAYSFRRAHAAAVRELTIDLAGELIGTDADDVVAHRAKMMAQTNFVGTSGIATMAIGCLDMALWDARAKHHGVPMSRMLGGVPRSLRMYGSGGSLDLSEEELVKEALSFKNRGYAGYKMRVGSCDLDQDLGRVAAVAAEVGPEFSLAVDVNQAWSREVAAEAIERLSDSRLAWVEEPLHMDDLNGLAALRAHSTLPIAAGESVYGEGGHARLLDAGAVDLLQPDLMRCGGVTGFIDVMAMARRRRTPVSPHLFTEMSASLLAATTNSGLVEHLEGWFERLFGRSPPLDEGFVMPEEEPGFGLELRADTLQSYASVAMSV